MTRHDIRAHLVPIGVLLWALTALLGLATAAPGALPVQASVVVVYVLLVAAAIRWTVAIRRDRAVS